MTPRIVPSITNYFKVLPFISKYRQLFKTDNWPLEGATGHDRLNPGIKHGVLLIGGLNHASLSVHRAIHEPPYTTHSKAGKAENIGCVHSREIPAQ